MRWQTTMRPSPDAWKVARKELVAGLLIATLCPKQERKRGFSQTWSYRIAVRAERRIRFSVMLPWPARRRRADYTPEAPWSGIGHDSRTDTHTPPPFLERLLMVTTTAGPWRNDSHELFGKGSTGVVSQTSAGSLAPGCGVLTCRLGLRTSSHPDTNANVVGLPQARRPRTPERRQQLL